MNGSSAPVLERARRIVVRAPNWLGDVVMSTPGLRALRRAAPAAHVTVLLPPALAPLLDGGDLVDEVWPLASRGGGVAGWRSDLGRLRAGRFDLGVVIPESISSALLMRAGGVRSVVGFARDPVRRALLHRVLPADPAWGRRRLVAREHFVMALMRGIGAEPVDDAIELATTADERARLERGLLAVGAEPARLLDSRPVVLAPGASFGDAKCWPAERYAALADRLVDAGVPVVVVGAPGESVRVHAVEETMQRRATVLDGVLDVGALKALLARARALVANDAGARHVAVGFGVPSAIFFGPTAVEKTAANLDRVTVLEREVGCRPCYRRRCPIDHPCLRGIDVEAAWRAVVALPSLDPPISEGAGASAAPAAGSDAWT